MKFNHSLFILKETLNAFNLHRGLITSASLSFYSMFAMIPMALILFFIISSLVISSSHAVHEIAIITNNLEPKLSRRIMTEIYRAASHKTAWSAVGGVLLLWISIPLASTLRNTFYTICAISEHPSFLKKALQDVLAVVGILLMFFIFTFLDLALSKLLGLFNIAMVRSIWFELIGAVLIIALLLGIFYQLFFPVKVEPRWLVLGSLLTATLWVAVKPLFNELINVNHSYGAIFGSMKNLFISLAWLYYSFIIFILGTELIATLNRQDLLLLRRLFSEKKGEYVPYVRNLFDRYGKTYKRGEMIFKAGQHGHHLFYIVTGEISLYLDGKLMRTMEKGDYFGEMALLTDTIRIADAVVESDYANILVIEQDITQSLI
ncbi:MAG: YhjD/YihY/BrkB family envelope integrity protein, partial [Methylophilaceae bacterium]